MQPTSLNETEWTALLARVTAFVDLTATALTHKAIERTRKIRDAATLLRLALIYGPCGASLRDTAAWATQMGLADLSDVAVLNRLRKSADWLEAVVSMILLGLSRISSSSLGGRTIRLVDGTCLSQPGSKGCDWRLHVSLDLVRSRFSHFTLTNGKGAESLQRHPWSKGDIAIADRGYARPRDLCALISSGVDVIVRVGWNALRMHQPKGEKFDLLEFLAKVPENQETAEVALELAASRSKKAPRSSVRLSVRRKPADAVAEELERLRRRASKKQCQLSQGSVVAASWMIIVTSLDAAIPADQVLSLYRLRWQIELSFKRLKSLMNLGSLPAKDTNLARTWIYAHLIIALLVDEISQEILDFPPCADWIPEYLNSDHFALADAA
jgi:hypothetical protein